ncbi:hypothetical protein [Curtobacterium sp. MCPF17_052]|uniref:hypothetical protein n=1 Tax=Curtobacterium sp. MCPF17_052 TaxID=2175655 RepID=UPI0024E023F1|nr:hypothetical protein [Curtobacterium sp. MCPF17_052]WIB13714.1 hypothetical protein DEJ36_08535 [Curtobacterium sp. MCPF17_052]
MTDRADRTPGWESVPDDESLHGDRVLPPAMTVTQSAPTSSGGRRPMRRGVVVGIVAGVAAVVLLVVAGGIGWSVGSDSHSAERPVESFLDDVEHGHLADALRTAGIDRGRDDVLLTDAAYARAGDKITAHRITSVQQGPDRATVQAVLTQAGRIVPATFELERSGTDWGVFPVWSLRAPALGSVQVVVQGPPRSTVQVAGVDVGTDASGGADLRAFPGSYGVHLDGGKWFTATDSTAAVPGFGAAGTPVVVATTLTDAGGAGGVEGRGRVGGRLCCLDLRGSRRLQLLRLRRGPGEHLLRPGMDARCATVGCRRGLGVEGVGGRDPFGGLGDVPGAVHGSGRPRHRHRRADHGERLGVDHRVQRRRRDLRVGRRQRPVRLRVLTSTTPVTPTADAPVSDLPRIDLVCRDG